MESKEKILKKEYLKMNVIFGIMGLVGGILCAVGGYSFRFEGQEQ